MSYSDKLKSLKQQMAGLSGDLLADIDKQVSVLVALVEDLPDEISLQFSGDAKAEEGVKHKEKLKSLKSNWTQCKKDVDGLIGGSGSKKKKSGGSSEGRKNIGIKEKQKSIKEFIEKKAGSFTRGDVEKHLAAEFERTIALAFYKPMLDYLVDSGAMTSHPEDKNNPKSAITYGLKQNKTVDFNGMNKQKN